MRRLASASRVAEAVAGDKDRDPALGDMRRVPSNPKLNYGDGRGFGDLAQEHRWKRRSLAAKCSVGWRKVGTAASRGARADAPSGWPPAGCANAL